MPEEKYIVDKNGNKRRMRRTYTDEFKQQIVNLYNTGNFTRAELMHEYELTEMINCLKHTIFYSFMVDENYNL